MLVWIVLLLVLLIGAGFLVWVGLRSREEDVETRVLELLQEGEEIRSIEDLELRQPFTERVILPIARRLGEFLVRFTPQQVIASTELDLLRAGLRGRWDPTVVVALRVILGIGLFIGGFFLMRLSPSPNLRRSALLMALIFGFLGFYLPVLFIKSRIARRQKEILKSFPDALDLLTICVQAGLGFDAAMQKLVEKWDNALSLEFARVLREVQLGKPRRDALRDMAERIGLPEVSSFVAAVVQAEQLGVSLSNILQIQADAMRLKRRQRAEEEARRAPIKMLFPLAFLIMPSLFIVLLGPSLFILLRSGVAAMFGG